MIELLTKQEYEEKENQLTKEMMEFAMSSAQFKKNGCYMKDFVTIDGEEISLLVMDTSWVAMPKDTFYEFVDKQISREEDINKLCEILDKSIKIKKSWKNLFGLLDSK